MMRVIGADDKGNVIIEKTCSKGISGDYAGAYAGLPAACREMHKVPECGAELGRTADCGYCGSYGTGGRDSGENKNKEGSGEIPKETVQQDKESDAAAGKKHIKIQTL